jgi:hypothetical protein
MSKGYCPACRTINNTMVTKSKCFACFVGQYGRKNANLKALKRLALLEDTLHKIAKPNNPSSLDTLLKAYEASPYIDMVNMPGEL